MSLVLAKPITEGQTMNKSSLLTIQERVPEEWLKEKKDESKNISQVSQIWLKNGTRFPKTTIPIQRSTIDDSMKNKQHYSYRKPQVPNSIIEHALAIYAAPRQIFGAEATINVWNPLVEEQYEFSLAQISIKFGMDRNTFTIEAGWHVLPSLYGDTKTRLYIYWTRDVGEAGCYNYFCEGFEMHSEMLGSPLTLSSLDNDQSHITILIKRDLLAHWWLKIDGRHIGYWPRYTFHHLKDAGSRVEWGGKVSNTRPHNRHTKTGMGSGRSAGEGFGKASYFYNLQVEETGDLKPIPSESLFLQMTNENCYDIRLAQRNSPGSDFFFGGQGFSSYNQILIGYNQILIALEDHKKTNFTCPFSTFAYRRIPFRLCNVAASFSTLYDDNFSEMRLNN
ncbi:uncharacterized protein LOC119998532 [Tripterygium wilfordii]|uniref:uncharacterized protein LOC119998532 n=1 Tax=Tripterygium wilfordii TaxID=458696 RepID=UPI0018F8102B|nr:uncharacterized protein LOC119998532 [Tripterygium wilfordii]